MRLVLATACFLIAAPAVAGEFPEALLGQWETDIENCMSPTPSSGQQVWFSAEEGEVTLSQVNHETEGGTCAITSTSNVGSDYLLTAECGMEESEVRQATHVLVTISDQYQIVLQSDWMNDEPLTFHSCDSPMDIGMGN